MADMTDRIREARALDIRDEARRLGIDIANGGKAWFRPGGRGPKGGSPSGSFFRRDGVWLWRERSSGEGGDVPRLVQHITGCTFGDALDLLLGADRVPLPPVSYAPAEERVDVPIEVRARACAAFYEALPPLGDAARGWLEDTRSVSSKTVSRFGLRQADERTGDAAMGAALQAVGADVVVALGLGVPSKHSDSLRCPFGWGCWIAIPYRDGGQILHLQFRRYSRSNDGDAKGPKYRHIKGTVPIPFNVEAADNGETPTMLVEGAFDAMALAQRGFPAVGVPGVSWLRQAGKADDVVRRAQVLVYGFDADEAGEDSREEVQAVLRAAGALAVREVVWPKGFRGDWCDFYAEGRALFEVREAKRPIPEGMFSAADLIRDGVDSLLAESRGEISKPGHRTGVDALDKWIRITEGSYTLLGGRPSDGKSQVLLSLAYSMAALGPRIGVLSLEMNRPQITERLAKSALKVGRDVPDDLSETYRRAASEIDALLALPVFVDCPDNPLEDNVRRRLDDMAEAGAEVIMLDYVQQIRCKGNGIEERTAKASSLIKTWAQRTGIPVIAAAALRRPENDREGAKRPRVEGLRGSGMLEFDADVVLLMHNGHKYDPERGCAAVRDLYLEKNRLGMVSPFAIQIEHPEPFGFFGELTYITQMRMHRDNQ